MFKRIGLFLITNLLVVMTLLTISRVFGIGHYLTAYGIDYTSLAVFSLVWGMGGALISLQMSRFVAKQFMGVRVIDPSATETVSDPRVRRLVPVVQQLSKAAGIPMPEVGVFQSPQPNAFATGPRKSASLVAVSTGLLERMSDDEVDGVLSHEIAHIANGDMVTMTLIQGVVNAFAIFMARALAYFIMNAMRRNDDEGSSMGFFAYYALHMVLEMVFLVLGSIVVASFSRHREFRADSGGAKLGGRENMIRALEALQRTYEIVDKDVPDAVATLQINGHGKLSALFATHPPLETRIMKLRQGA